MNMNMSLRNRVAVVVMALLTVLHVGCRTHTDDRSARTNDSGLPALTSNESSANKTLTHVVLGDQPTAFSFKVENTDVGTELDDLGDYLRKIEAKYVIFESEYKLTTKRVADLKSFFAATGIEVREFWVPISSRPGRIDLMKLR